MRQNIRAPLAGCFACTVGLIVLALLAYGAGTVQQLDARVLAYFVTHSGSGAESLATAVAHLGDVPALLLLLALACGIGLIRGRPRDAVAALAVVAGANLTTQMLKTLLFSHPRFREILGAEQFAWDGFPSGHVTAVTSIVIAFAFVVPRGLGPLVAAVGVCFVTAISWAVLALNWHYPSDAVGGILVASAWGFAVLAGLRAVEGRRFRRAPQLGRRAAISVK